ncbi:MAG: rRNA pseudouridine synthase [Clostridia bacterium]|nr:rRNA pseudouridine synthase [Clostridia bacterium]
MNSVKLQKYIADCGVLSRRAAEREIEAGKVKVNGAVAAIGDRVTQGEDRVVWNGRGITPKTKTRTVVALNKPRGYVSTSDDEKGRKKITDLVSDLGRRLYPVGRLDMASEGLIFLTDDGDFANLLTHPKYHLAKVYRVSVAGNPDDEVIASLAEPIVIDGRKTMPAKVALIDRLSDGCRIEFTLFEGRNRQIRRICEKAGLEVKRLKRVRIGTVSVNGIAPGKYRILSDSEVSVLKKLAKNGDGGEFYAQGPSDSD